MAEQFNLPLLGEIPLTGDIVAGGDAGTPLVIAQPGHPQSQTFLGIAQQVLNQLEQVAMRDGQSTTLQ